MTARTRVHGVSEAERVQPYATAAGRIPELDGLRAVAVFAVIVFHAFGATMLPGGYIGVDVFFVLSGFIITDRLIAEAQRGPISLRRFYERRIRRIWPALFFLLAIWCAAITILRFSTGVVTGHGYYEALLSALGIMNWARAFELSSGGALGHLWSLSVEEQFYLLWPFLFATLFRLRLRTALSCLMLLIAISALWRLGLSISGATPERTYNGLDTRADALLVGCLAAFLPASVRSQLHLGWWPLPASFLVLVALTAEWTGSIMHRGGFTMTAVASAWLMLAALRQKGVLSRILASSLATFLGRRSYSLYLWHYPLFALGQTYSSWTFLDQVSAILLAVIASDLSHRYVERPFLALGKQKAQA